MDQPLIIRHRGGQKQGAAVHEFCQKRNRTQARLQIFAGEQVRFIEYQYAARHIVYLAQTAAPVGVQRFEELHGGRYDDLRVPVFCVLARQQRFVL